MPITVSRRGCPALSYPGLQKKLLFFFLRPVKNDRFLHKQTHKRRLRRSLWVGAGKPEGCVGVHWTSTEPHRTATEHRDQSKLVRIEIFARVPCRYNIPLLFKLILAGKKLGATSAMVDRLVTSILCQIKH